MNIDTLERHGDTVPAFLIIGLSDRALREELWHIAFDLIKEAQNRTFGRFLLEICYREIGRRSSEGEIEAASFQIPYLEPAEIAAALLVTNLVTYAEFCDSLGKIFDHLHINFIEQASHYLRAIKQ